MKRIAFLATLAVAGSAHAIVIDDFTTGSFSQDLTTGSWVGSQAGSMLGGERDAGFVVLDNPQSVNVHMEAGSGFYVGAGGSQAMAEFGLDYDGAGDEIDNTAPFEYGPGLTGFGLSASESVRISFLANDQDLTVNVFALSGQGTGTSSSTTIVAGGQTSPFDVDFSFASFTGNADLSNIDRLVIVFDTSPSGDFALSQVSTVPEPASMAILGLGALGLIRRRRAAKK